MAKTPPKLLPNRRRPAKQPYDVGYAKPPRQHQFKPGRSGNPGGRPKNSRNRSKETEYDRLKALVLDEAYRTVPVTEQGQTREMPIIQAALRSLAVNAAKGDRRAQALIIPLVGKIENDLAQTTLEYIDAVMDYQARARVELRNRQQSGLKGPPLIPHPDDIVMDLQTGKIGFRGPQTEEQYASWAKLRDRLKDARKAIAELSAMTADPENANIINFINDDLASERILADRIHSLIGDWDR